MAQRHDGSVLGLCSKADVTDQPYAHIVADAPFEPALYRRLAESFPPTDWFLGGLDEVESNQAVRIPASHVIGNEKFSPEWQDFFHYHTSQEFWGDIVRVFGDSLRATYPDLESRAGLAFEDWRVKLRNESGEAQVNLDLLFVINTAVERPSSVRPPHVDDEKKIFSGLFYMKPDDDPTPGGDLAISMFVAILVGAEVDANEIALGSTASPPGRRRVRLRAQGGTVPCRGCSKNLSLPSAHRASPSRGFARYPGR